MSPQNESGHRPRLTLLGRPDCHLCEEFEEELRAHPRAQVFEIQRADVDSRADWRDQFGRRIPVLLDQNGELVCEVHFDAAALNRLTA